jgi:periplasmic copper chaperone A
MAASASTASRGKIMNVGYVIGRRQYSVFARIARALIVGAWLAPAAPLATAAAADAPPSSGPSQLSIRDAWIRWLPSGLPAAGYMTLVNGSDRALELTAVSGDAYREIGLHRSVTQSGMSRMESVNAISVPPHSALRFEAGGYHLMLMQPTHALAPGDHVALTLHFAGGATRSVNFEVRAPNGSAPASGDMNGMQGMHDMQGMHSQPPPTTPR